MEKKKPKKKVTKTKFKGKVTAPTPIVVETKSPLTEEEQNENPLGRIKTPLTASGVLATLPNGFKTADTVTEMDDLVFENKKLRDMLTMWNHKRKFNGMWYYFLVDPLNQTIDMFDTDPTAGGGE